MPQSVSKAEIIASVKNAGVGYHLVTAMQDLSRQAAEGDSVALDALGEMLEECRDTKFWIRNSRYCSAVVHAVAHVGAMRSMKLLVDFVRGLSPDAPYGVVELISSILPTYRRIVMGSVMQLLEEAPDGPARAVGLQTLCNMYLDHALQGEQIRFLEQTLQNFDRDNYLTQTVADLVRLEMAYREEEAAADLEAMLHGFLIETPDHSN
ncbi:MAG: hypothetical protein K1X75_17215 [Leptospirales bacterium]|nr:hypothetical protein [Leptospirales bacterium]